MFRDDRCFSKHEVLLDTSGLHGVVKVHAVCERVSDDVSANFNAGVGRSRFHHERFVLEGIEPHDHGVHTGVNRVNKLVGLDSHPASCFGSEHGRERVFGHSPAVRTGLDVQVDVRPNAFVVVVVNRFTRHDLRERTVFIQVRFGRLITHAL